MYLFIVVAWLVALLNWTKEEPSDRKQIIIKSISILVGLYIVWLFAYLNSYDVPFYLHFPVTLIGSMVLVLILHITKKSNFIRYVTLAPSGIHLALILVTLLFFGVGER